MKITKNSSEPGSILNRQDITLSRWVQCDVQERFKFELLLKIQQHESKQTIMGEG